MKSALQTMQPANRFRTKRKLLIGILATCLLMLLIWAIYDTPRPDVAPTTLEGKLIMDRLRWFGISVLAVIILLLFGANWQHPSSVKNNSLPAAASETLTPEAQEQARREYVLEILGMGVTVEKYRQGKLWEILQKGNAFTSIRETDPSNIPITVSDKLGQSGGRALDALQNGAEPSPMYWGVPSFYAGPPMLDPAKQPSAIDPSAGLVNGAEGTGMAWHLFVIGPWLRAERPDDLLEQVFAFFDEHPTVPYVVVSAMDGPERRYRAMAPESPSPVKHGQYIPDMPDATAVFVLARRERVEPMRPFVWYDPNNDYMQENLRMMYYELMEEVPNRRKLEHSEEVNIGRQPTVTEWLKATEEFAKHPFVKQKPDPTDPTWKGRGWRNNPPKTWKPIPWFPVPWNEDQMRTFDKLPSLGFLHRPVFIKFEDEDGRPVKRRDARQKILEAGWQQALLTLPEAERAQGPARIIAAFDNNNEQIIALEGLLNQYASQGGPEFDSNDIRQFINTDRRLGNTGAATFFVQMALGVLGSSIEGGISAAINLREAAGASIVFISPPAHKRGQGDFKHEVKPMIDPDNYKPPTMDDVLGSRK